MFTDIVLTKNHDWKSAVNRKFMRRPMIPLLFVFIAGLITGNSIYIPNAAVLSFLLATFLFILFFIIKKSEFSILIGLFISFFLMGILNINLCFYPQPIKDDICRYVDSGKITVEGIIQKTKTSPDKVYLTIKVEKVLAEGRNITASGKILLAVKGGNDLFKYGDYIRVITKLSKPSNFDNPGGFDYVKYLLSKNIQVRGFVGKPSNIIVTREDTGNPFMAYIEASRSKTRKFILKGSPSPERELVRALILGEKEGIPEEVLENFRRTGTSHILAISGLHVGIIALISFAVVGLVIRSSEYLTLKFNAVKISALIAILPIAAYILIAGFRISTIRAAIMILSFLLAIFIGRERDMFNTLAFAAFVILITMPASLFDVSFQLSFAAVASIIFAAPIIFSSASGTNRQKSHLDRILLSILAFIIVSLSATLGTIPIIAFYFNRISTVSLLSNLFAVPVIGFVSLPVGMAAIAIAPLSSPLASLLINTSLFFVRIGILIIDLIAKLPHPSFFVTTPNLIEITAYYALLIVSVKLIDLWKRKNSSCSQDSKTCRTERHYSKGRDIALKTAFVLLVVFFLTDAIYLHARDRNTGCLRATFIDVGQGSSTLIEFPKGTKMLVDGGGFYTNTFDLGKNVVAPFLWHERIGKIDVVVLTHPDQDHIGGLVYILKNFDVKEVWSNGEESESDSYAAFKNVIKEENIPHRILSKNTPQMEFGEAYIKILNPSKPPDRNSSSPYKTSSNDNGMVMKITFGDVAILLPSDITRFAEKRLSVDEKDLKSDILSAPHHGSATSSSSIFIEKVRPKIVVFSCGKKNNFNFPNPGVVEKYEKIGARIFRTDKNGAVAIETDGKNIVTCCFKGN